MQERFSREDFIIDCGTVKAIRRSGNMFARIPCGRDWSNDRRIGRIQGACMRFGGLGIEYGADRQVRPYPGPTSKTQLQPGDNGAAAGEIVVINDRVEAIILIAQIQNAGFDARAPLPEPIPTDDIEMPEIITGLAGKVFRVFLSIPNRFKAGEEAGGVIEVHMKVQLVEKAFSI